jgi:hypothetical protein
VLLILSFFGFAFLVAFLAQGEAGLHWLITAIGCWILAALLAEIKIKNFKKNTKQS